MEAVARPLPSVELADAVYRKVFELNPRARLRMLPPLEVERLETDHRAARERRRARHVQQVGELLATRAELRGVSPVADFFAEAASWTA